MRFRKVTPCHDTHGDDVAVTQQQTGKIEMAVLGEGL